MGTLGPNSASTFTDDSLLGTIGITNASNAQSSDNSYATTILLLTQVSHYLKATNFGFSIPIDAIITGITVEIERSTTVLASLVDNSVKLVKGNTISGSNNALGINWPTSDAYAVYGSPSDLWGLTLTPADVNDSTFGVAISTIASLLAGTGQIDHIRITVDYLGSNRPGNMLNRLVSGDGMSVGDTVR